MRTLRIDEYETYPRRYPIRVRVADLNYGNHLAHDAMLRLAQEVRLEFLAELGCESELSVGTGMALMVLDAAVVYRAEAWRGDQLVFHTGVSELGPCGFRLAHRVTHADGRVVALLDIGLVVVRTASRRIGRLPAELAAGLAVLRLERAVGAP